MTDKLDTQLDTSEIKQTRDRTDPIRFRDDSINKIRKENYEFGNKRYKYIPFQVSKDTHQKGLTLKILKGRPGDKHTDKIFYVRFWFNGAKQMHWIGKYSQKFGVKECNDYCIELDKTHKDPKSGYWIKNPNDTRRNEQRIIPLEDTSVPTDITVNEVIEAYCGAETLNPLTKNMEEERGFLKDYKQGYRTSKSCKNWFRYMAGYNKRQSLITFEDDENGYGVAKFLPNKHLRANAPRSVRDLFRKFPPGTGVLKPRTYYNRKSKQTYTTGYTKNKSIYDSDLGKGEIAKLTPGGIEAWIRPLSSRAVKEDYVKVFSTLWIYARKRGWLGTNPGDCPFYDGKVYVKKEPQGQDPYKDVSINPSEFEVFWKASEELSEQFPFKAELHQFMLLTALRKVEALKVEKSFIDWKGGVINIPKGIEKNRYKDQIIIITPELEILLRNILDLGNRPGLSFYKMKDFRWLFATRKWGADKYFDKDFRLSIKTRLGGDENYVPALRTRMKELLGSPEDFIYSSKVLRKTYITLSKQMNEGRSDRVRHLSRHGSEEILEQSYHKPSIPMVRDFANKTTEVLKFIRRRSA